MTLTPSQSNQYNKNRATFNPTDELVLSDGVLWDVTSGKEIHKFDKLNQTLSGVFHPNGLEVSLHVCGRKPSLNSAQLSERKKYAKELITTLVSEFIHVFGLRNNVLLQCVELYRPFMRYKLIYFPSILESTFLVKVESASVTRMTTSLVFVDIFVNKLQVFPFFPVYLNSIYDCGQMKMNTTIESNVKNTFRIN